MSQVSWKNHALFFTSSGLPVHYNSPVNFQQEPGWQITGGEIPKHPSFPGKVYLENKVTGLTRVLNANIVGCKWQPIEPVKERREK